MTREHQRRMDERVDGRVAIVTGGSRGLGLALTHALVDRGYRVVVDARGADALERAVAGLGNVVAVAGDVADPKHRRALVDAAGGRIDVLVNNAGMSPLYESLGGVTEQLWDKVIAVNLKGPFRLCALVGERMAAADGGAIINVSSTGAVRPTADIIPYAASKAGVNAMTVGLADALGPKVRVNAIMPGPFLTSIAKSWDMDMLAERTETFALRRAGEAREIVGAALYLASDASSFTTGTIVTVDGGARWSMPGGGGTPTREARDHE
jgi:NAD(P)-dependent dehydrogenase (short-subunit alcohol dehydrogenase family)